MLTLQYSPPNPTVHVTMYEGGVTAAPFLEAPVICARKHKRVECSGDGGLGSKGCGSG